jgi:lipopolysaccharide transport system permease protein
MATVSPDLASSSTPTRVLRIQPSGRRISIDLRELWEYRELMAFLVWRDIKVRYVQTVLGPMWALVVPLIQMLLFTVIFGRLGGLQGEYKVPYPLFVFSGLLPWMYFQSCLSQSSRSVVSNQNLVTKVYVPRLIIPIASIVVPLIDIFIVFGVLLGLFAWYHRAPHWHIVVTPFFLVMALLTAFGVGLWLSALNVRFRDIPYLVPLATQLWFFSTPVVYGATAVPPKWQWLIALNPLTGVIDGFRWAVLGRGIPHYHLFLASIGTGLFLSISGLVYFKYVERQFADVI